MGSKNWLWVAVIFLSVIVAYQAGKFAGKNSAESISRDKELVFQKEKEETRKAEFVKLLRIHEKEKIEERNKEAIERLDESSDRQTDLLIKSMEILMQNSQYKPEASNYFLANTNEDYSVPYCNTKHSQKGLVGSIVYNESRPSSLINDQIIHEGDIIDGVTIIRIHEDKVEFEKNGKHWTQELGETPSPLWQQ